jgi:hypothetical protein
MSSSEKPTPHKETIFLHGISPELEEELLSRARESGCDPSREAADIIERYIEENSDDIS